MIRTGLLHPARPLPWMVTFELLLGNLLVSHGRRPFVGPRHVLVAMSRD
jgi:hypothetical protein